MALRYITEFNFSAEDFKCLQLFYALNQIVLTAIAKVKNIKYIFAQNSIDFMFSRC